MMLISSSYVISSDAVNQQIDELNAILKKYDEGGMLIGEAPCTKDLINCTDRDFKGGQCHLHRRDFRHHRVGAQSFSLPILLVAIDRACHCAQPVFRYFTGTTLSVCRPDPDFDAIQLGATVGLRHSDDHAV